MTTVPDRNSSIVSNYHDCNGDGGMIYDPVFGGTGGGGPGSIDTNRGIFLDNDIGPAEVGLSALCTDLKNNDRASSPGKEN